MTCLIPFKLLKVFRAVNFLCGMKNNNLISSGLSLREFILQFKHKSVLLFKLLLLEKRVIFFKSPVQQLCATILSILSLHPGLIEKGLKEAACVKYEKLNYCVMFD